MAVAVVVLTLALPTATGAGRGLADDAAPPTGPRALTILPTGEGNTITLDQFLGKRRRATAGTRVRTRQQLDMYNNWQFKDAALSPDADHVQGAVSSESPIPGLRIVRDTRGVPHVFASGPDEQSIEENVGFGVGWAQAKERLFQMEVLRRARPGPCRTWSGPERATPP